MSLCEGEIHNFKSLLSPYNFGEKCFNLLIILAPVNEVG